MTDTEKKDGASTTLADKLLFLDPKDELDQYVVGLGEGFGNEAITVVYDKDLLLEHWAKSFSEGEADFEDDDAYTMAVEWFEYNVIGAYVGPHTPVYISRSYLQVFLEDRDDSQEPDEPTDDSLVMLEPREHLDKFIVGIGLGFGGTISYMYDKDRLLEYWTKSFMNEHTDISRDDAFNMALDVFETMATTGANSEFPPSFVSRDEFEVFKSKTQTQT